MCIRDSSKQTELNITQSCSALYVRVSTELQASEGYSLEAQRAKLEAYCLAMGWEVCAEHIYIEAGASGKTTDRPAFNAMMEAARSGAIKRIVAVKLDRIARNVRAFLELVDTLQAIGVDLVLLTESFDTGTPSGKFALTMFAAMAELERSTIKERMTSGKLQKARQGGYNGSATPLGYTYENGQWGIDESAAETVKRMFQMFNEGASLRGIATELGMNHTSVRYMLGNGTYAGLAQYDGIETVGQCPSIIDRATYEAAETRLQNLKRGNPNFAK